MVARAASREPRGRRGPGVVGMILTVGLMVGALYLSRVASTFLPPATEERLLTLANLLPVSISLALLVPTWLVARTWRSAGAVGYFVTYLALAMSLGAGLYIADVRSGPGLSLLVAYCVVGLLGSLGNTVMLRVYRCGACEKQRRIWVRRPHLCRGPFPSRGRSVCVRERPPMICPQCWSARNDACCSGCMERFECWHEDKCDLRTEPSCGGLDQQNPCGASTGARRVCARHDARSPTGKGRMCQHCSRAHHMRTNPRRPVEQASIICQICNQPGTDADPVTYCHSTSCRGVAHKACFENEGRWCSFARCELNTEEWRLPEPERRQALAGLSQRKKSMETEAERLRQKLAGRLSSKKADAGSAGAVEDD